MFTIKTTDEFDKWLESLRDSRARLRILARLRKYLMDYSVMCNLLVKVFRKRVNILERDIVFISFNAASP